MPSRLFAGEGLFEITHALPFLEKLAMVLHPLEPAAQLLIVFLVLALGDDPALDFKYGHVRSPENVTVTAGDTGGISGCA
jgi:hypothetical protein